MDIENEIEKLESIIADIKSAISEAENYSYFEYKVSAWEEDLSELNDRLQELESRQNKQWEAEDRHIVNEYWGAVI